MRQGGADRRWWVVRCWRIRRHGTWRMGFMTLSAPHVWLLHCATVRGGRLTNFGPIRDSASQSQYPAAPISPPLRPPCAPPTRRCTSPPPLQFSVGLGTGLAYLNNLGSIVVALGGKQGGQVVFVSLFSVANATGRRGRGRKRGTGRKPIVWSFLLGCCGRERAAGNDWDGESHEASGLALSRCPPNALVASPRSREQPFRSTSPTPVTPPSNCPFAHLS